MRVLLYDFQLSLKVSRQVGEELTVTHFYSTEIEGFSVFGGVNRLIRRDDGNGRRDVAIMAEICQARRFFNIFVQKKINRQTEAIERLYHERLSFDFTFAAESFAPGSKFKSLQLLAKNARIIEPPVRNSREELVKIRFSEPKILYWHDSVKGNRTTVVKEEL